jgi:hypothetical protein
MKTSVRRELAQAARRYWEEAPWKDICDYHNFGFRDAKTGQMACAVVLGNAGYEYGLGLYLGIEGFEVARRIAQSQMDKDEFAFRADLLSIAYTPASEIPTTKRKSLGVLCEISDSTGEILPHLIRKRPFQAASLPEDPDAILLGSVLRAVPQLLSEGRISPKRLEDRTNMPIFVLPVSPGEPLLEEKAPPLSEEPKFPDVPKLTLDPSTRAKLTGEPRRGVLLVSLTTGPVSVRKEQARMLLVLDPERDLVLTGRAFLGPDSVIEAARYLLSTMTGESRPAVGDHIVVPDKLATDSLEFYGSIKAAFADMGVQVLYAERIPPLEKVRESFLEYMARRPKR